MADVITRFKLETTQYDSKLRDASKGLAEYARTASLSGKEFDKFTKNNVAAAKAFGSIETSATNAKDKVKELVGAYNDMARAYNSLTKEQQQSDWAKAMAQSLQQLQVRIKEAKQEMYGLNDATKSMRGSASGGSDMSGMMAVFGGNLMARGAEVGISYMKDFGRAMYDTVQQSVELSRNAEGVRTAFERLNRPGLLDNLREATHGTVSDLELMKQAVKFNDFNLDVEQLGAFLAFAQQKAKDTGESVDYLVNSIVTGLGRKSLMILDNLGLSAAEIKEKMAETGDMTTAVAEIIRERMGEAGDYIETAFDRGARSAAELENATLKLGDSFRQTFGYEGFGEVGNVIETRLLNDFTQLIQSVDLLTSKLSNMGIEGNRALTALADTTFYLLAGPLGALMALTGNSFKNYAVNGGTGATGGHIIKRNTAGGGGGGGTTTPRGGRGGGGSQELDVMAANSKMITELSKKAITATDEERMAIREKIKALQDQNKEYQYYIDLVTGKIKPHSQTEEGKGIGLGTVNSISQEISKPLDVSAIKTPLQSLEEELKNLIELRDSAFSAEGWQTADMLVKSKQQEISEYKGEGKKQQDPLNKFSKDFSQILGSVNNISNGIQSIGVEIPEEIQNAMSVMSGILSVVQGISSILLVIEALDKAQTATSFIPFFSQGGIVPHAANGYLVPGNSYSGDNTLIAANAGELVLSASQQSMLANNLQNNGGVSVHVTGVLRGEDIALIADRWGRRTGKGELLFGKNL